MKVRASIAAGQSLTADDIDTVMKLMPKWVAGFRKCVLIVGKMAAFRIGVDLNSQRLEHQRMPNSIEIDNESLK